MFGSRQSPYSSMGQYGPRRNYSTYGRPSARLPHLRLGTMLVLLVVCFFMGMYLPGWMGMAPTESLGRGNDGSMSRENFAVSTPDLLERVQILKARMTDAEKKAAAVLEENQKLRLDNEIEQANLKTLTKAKNEEIRGLQARIDSTEEKLDATKKQNVDGNEKEELHKTRSEIKDMEDQIKSLKKQLELASQKSPSDSTHQHEKAAAGSIPSSKKEPKKSEVVDVVKKPLLTRKTVSVPEPQPLNPLWEARLHALFDLAQSDPASLLSKLDDSNADPLGVNVGGPTNFTCPPPSERLTQPDLRRIEVATQFRGGHGFVFFQHLRKAGGTGFCDMASRNMPGHVPSYYCMPDHRGTLATPPWTTSWLLDTIEEKSFRIAANEWDPFLRAWFAIGDAVFATTIRDPTDRWYSQYRFEHVEHRDGTTQNSVPKPFDVWYGQEHSRNMGHNYYVKTFLGEATETEPLQRKGPNGVPLVHGNFYWAYNKYQARVLTWEDFRMAMDTLLRFHVVLVMEWLDEANATMKSTLGWTEAPRQILPHEVQAARQEKKSKSARALLDKKVFDSTREANVLDHLFFEAARRIFLERHACESA